MSIHFDVSTYPLEKIVEKALSPADQAFHTGCQLLAGRAYGARDEVTVVLLGLLAVYGHDLERLTVIVRSLRTVPCDASAERLFAELRRVKSNNTTRRYLTAVLDTLADYPPHLTTHGFAELAEDRSFSQRRRAQFRALADGYAGCEDEGESGRIVLLCLDDS